MKSSYLYLSPEFAYHLSKLGLLPALIDALKSFKQRQNYPFELKDKRIIRQALAKPYFDLMGDLLMMCKNPEEANEQFKTIKTFLLKEIEEDTDRVYGNKPLTAGEETFKTIQEIEEIHKSLKASKKLGLKPKVKKRKLVKKKDVK